MQLLSIKNKKEGCRSNSMVFLEFWSVALCGYIIINQAFYLVDRKLAPFQYNVIFNNLYNNNELLNDFY